MLVYFFIHFVKLKMSSKSENCIFCGPMEYILDVLVNHSFHIVSTMSNEQNCCVNFKNEKNLN